jgi:mRNA interferase MazF
MLIVSHDAFNTHDRYPKVMVVHLTSVQHAKGPFQWEVELPRGTAGLAKTSIAKCGEIYTLLKEQLEGRLGSLPQVLMRRVDRSLALALDLPTPIDVTE